MLLNVKMRAINSWILERGLIVKLLDVLMYLCKRTINTLNMAMLPPPSFKHFPFSTPTYASVSLLLVLLLLPGREPSQREETGSWSQEEHMPPVAGCWLPLFRTHGSRTGERHTQLPGLSLWNSYSVMTIIFVFDFHSTVSFYLTGKVFLYVNDFVSFLTQIELIDRVDDIYRNTTWDDEFKGYGVQIAQVCVYVCVCALWYGSSLTAWIITHPLQPNGSVYAKSLPEAKLWIKLSFTGFENNTFRRNWKLLFKPCGVI